MGVRSLLEGIIRRSGGRLRINASLIEGASAAHLWADSFDGASEDVFDLQDRLTGQIVGIIEPTIQRAEIERARQKRPENLDAYDLYLRALPMGAQVLKNAVMPVEVFRVVNSSAAKIIVAPGPEIGRDDRRSTAVLPFTRMGGDVADQHFADGLTEDIITELSRVSFLHAAARIASFRFRGPDADIAAAARTLGVRFAVEGSVRRLGPRLRLSAQLIDTATGAHLWAERYDRPAEGIHDVQDEVVRSNATTAASRLHIAGADMARRKPEDQRSAQDLILQAEADWAIPSAQKATMTLARQALDIDPTSARAHAILAFLLAFEWIDSYDLPDSALDTALDHARSAVALDPGRDGACGPAALTPRALHGERAAARTDTMCRWTGAVVSPNYSTHQRKPPP